MISRRTSVLAALFLVLGLASALIFIPPAEVQPLPDRISDLEFWDMVIGFSEPGGYFRSDNFVSNEKSSQTVIPELRARTRPGGVYLGVGPDQNFTYIAAIKPRISFIVDIRRQAMLQHLMYKALFELSGSRAEFLSRLFCRRLTTEVPVDAPPADLFAALDMEEGDKESEKKNLDEIFSRLQQHHRFPLTADDRRGIQYIYSSFVAAGPEIRYSFPSQSSWRRFPTYADLMQQTDATGQNHSYIANNQNFDFVKQLHHANRIIPLVGNFAGKDVLRAIGKYLRKHGATVSAFYTSNVEFYLFQSDDWKRFYNNVSDLPLDDQSTFIRAWFDNTDYSFTSQPEVRSTTLLDSMSRLKKGFHDGQILMYQDVINILR